MSKWLILSPLNTDNAFTQTNQNPPKFWHFLFTRPRGLHWVCHSRRTVSCRSSWSIPKPRSPNPTRASQPCSSTPTRTCQSLTRTRTRHISIASLYPDSLNVTAPLDYHISATTTITRIQRRTNPNFSARPTIRKPTEPSKFWHRQINQIPFTSFHLHWDLHRVGKSHLNYIRKGRNFRCLYWRLRWNSRCK